MTNDEIQMNLAFWMEGKCILFHEIYSQGKDSQTIFKKLKSGGT